MRAYFARHGDKEKGDFYDPALRHQDEPLSKAGIRGAVALADYFAGREIGQVYASQYLRAGQTAKFTAARKGLTVVRDARLNEIDNGVLESMNDEEIKALYPDFWADFSAREADVRFPEGETGEEVKARQAEFLADLARDGRDALAVCHEGYIRLLACHVLGLPVYKRHLFTVDFCGFLEIGYDGAQNGWRLIRMNQATY